MTGEIMKVANGEEAVVLIPVVVPPVEVEIPLGVVLVEFRHVAIVTDLRDRALVKSAIRTTTHRMLSGLNCMCDLVCRQRSPPTVSDFLRRTRRHAPSNRNRLNSRLRACEQTI